MKKHNARQVKRVAAQSSTKAGGRKDNSDTVIPGESTASPAASSIAWVGTKENSKVNGVKRESDDRSSSQGNIVLPRNVKSEGFSSETNPRVTCETVQVQPEYSQKTQPQQQQQHVQVREGDQHRQQIKEGVLSSTNSIKCEPTVCYQDVSRREGHPNNGAASDHQYLHHRKEAHHTDNQATTSPSVVVSSDYINTHHPNYAQGSSCHLLYTDMIAGQQTYRSNLHDLEHDHQPQTRASVTGHTRISGVPAPQSGTSTHQQLEHMQDSISGSTFSHHQVARQFLEQELAHNTMQAYSFASTMATRDVNHKSSKGK